MDFGAQEKMIVKRCPAKTRAVSGALIRVLRTQQSESGLFDKRRGPGEIWQVGFLIFQWLNEGVFKAEFERTAGDFVFLRAAPASTLEIQPPI